MAIVQRRLQIVLTPAGQTKSKTITFSGIGTDVSDSALLSAARGLGSLLADGEKAYSKVDVSSLA
ncbi:MAG: DUF1659 domain-containing protein [Veillonellaceae bacterium]|nr:DUF1659 domain-containing protein [Veillonellaceae bacterium]